ncbi:hypothetical protein RhiirA4_439523 [Rhizophagus irregularis]|uniref:Uncharacterized protein n=1 Tax=Rhizophagus irregularis TaxID=588596 RepID=A0A2I1FW80_9GLOM|nr:hypothetical protein RhiirA4_439523 [Rhizophagus irregularis]
MYPPSSSLPEVYTTSPDHVVILAFRDFGVIYRILMRLCVKRERLSLMESCTNFEAPKSQASFSRDFCKETVDLLWRKPFHFLYTCNNNSKSNNQCYCAKDKRKYQAANLLMTYLLIKRDKEFVKKGTIKVER